MNAHRLEASQLIPRPVDDVFAFFSEPRNLGRITPGDMRFEFLTDDFEMRDGLEIEYRLRPLFGVPTKWRTEIADFHSPHGFTDIQKSGPYRRWEHHHSFRAVPGGTLVEDRIDYELPLGDLGNLGHGIVRGELERIFRHRAQALEHIFERPGQTEAPMTVAVAGGTGFVGGGIARELRRRGNRVVVLSHRGESARGALPDDVEIRVADATAEDGHDSLVVALHDVDALVISLAFANLPVEAPMRGRTFAAVDAAGTERLVAAARDAGVMHLVYMSGAGAAPDASRHWFRAKWRAEEAVRGSEIPWTIIRPTWIYGPGDNSLNRFVGFGRRLPFVPMSNFGRQLLAPVFIDDVGRLVADSLIDANANDQVFELGGPETLSMREIIGRALGAAGIDKPVVPGPAPLIKLGVAPLSLLPSPPMTPSAIDFVNQPATVDVEPLLERMPRRLTPLDEGLATYLPADSMPGELAVDRQPVAAAA